MSRLNDQYNDFASQAMRAGKSDNNKQLVFAILAVANRLDALIAAQQQTNHTLNMIQQKINR